MHSKIGKSVIDWMREATEEEIVEAMMVVGPAKAVRVVALLTSRLGPEAAMQVRDAIDQTRADPVDAFARVALAGVGVLSRKRRGR